jgi:hypothetical protein
VDCIHVRRVSHCRSKSAANAGCAVGPVARWAELVRPFAIPMTTCLLTSFMIKYLPGNRDLEFPCEEPVRLGISGPCTLALCLAGPTLLLGGLGCRCIAQNAYVLGRRVKRVFGSYLAIVRPVRANKDWSTVLFVRMRSGVVAL